MSVVYKINGKTVTKQEADRWFSRRKELFGADRFDFSKWNGQVPAIRTDDTFMRGKKDQSSLNQEFDDVATQDARKKASLAGVSTTGKFYYGSLADHANDPEAWCGSASEVIALAKRKKAKIELNGRTHDFREKYRDPPQQNGYEVAKDIVDREVKSEMNKRFGKQAARVSAKERQEIKEQVRKAVTSEF